MSNFPPKSWTYMGEHLRGAEMNQPVAKTDCALGFFKSLFVLLLGY